MTSPLELGDISRRRATLEGVFEAMKSMSTSLRSPGRSSRTSHSTHSTRTRDASARAKKGGAFLKEFGPESSGEEKKETKDGEQKVEIDIAERFPKLEKVEGQEPFSANIMAKKVGMANVIWNGVGTLQTPNVGDKKASVNLARVCLAQRAEVLIENFNRLYPKLANEQIEWAIQPFDDPYGDKFDPFMTLPDDKLDEFVPGNLQFLKKPRKVAQGQ